MWSLSLEISDLTALTLVRVWDDKMPTGWDEVGWDEWHTHCDRASGYCWSGKRWGESSAWVTLESSSHEDVNGWGSLIVELDHSWL